MQISKCRFQNADCRMQSAEWGKGRFQIGNALPIWRVDGLTGSGI